MQLTNAKLSEQLRAAFPSKVIQSEGAFQGWGATYLDAEPYMKQIEGKTWEELDRSYLIMRSDALGFLGTRHLVAVLPVYLHSLIEEGVWSQGSETLMLLLTKPDPTKKTGIKPTRFKAFVGALTRAQCVVIAVLLRAFAATDERGSLGKAADVALERYWNTYLAPGS